MARIDWSRRADPNSVQVSLDLLRTENPLSDLGLESLTEATGASSHRSERQQLDRLADTLNAKKPTLAGEDQELTQKVLDGARSGLAKLNQGEAAESFTLGEQMGLESVVLTDGTRPSLLIQNGFVDLKSPEVGMHFTPVSPMGGDRWRGRRPG